MEASAAHAPARLGRLAVRGPLLRLRSDDQLVALFRMGYEEAFDVVHDRYRPRLLAYTRQMLGGARTDAEDVLQDVFLRAYRALRHDDRPVTLRAWLYRVAHNRCVDHLRRPAPPVAEVYELSRAPQHDPSDETERREDLRRLVQDMRRLPDQQRSALLMREIDGLSYAELADVLGTTVPAIKSLLVRARVGLVEAGEARDTACVEIRADLASAHGRGVRPSARSRRHLRDCPGCREYRSGLRGECAGQAALSAGGGPFATLAKLLGLGGASSGAAAGAGAGGSAVAVGGASAVTATKVVAIVCCAAVVGGGAVEMKAGHPAPARHRTAHHAAPAAAHAPAGVPARSAAATTVGAPAGRTPANAGPRRRAGTPAVASRPQRAAHGASPAHTGGATAKPDAATTPQAQSDAAPPTQTTDTSATVTPTPDEMQTGGALAPDENAPQSTDPASSGADGGAQPLQTGSASPATGSAPGDPGSGQPATTDSSGSPRTDGARAPAARRSGDG